MLDLVIAFSLKNRWLVLLAALALVVAGTYRLAHAPVDVFPDLNRPTVTFMTEAPGLAPEEVEVLVTRPLEYQLNGATGVRRVRSASGVGLSVVWVEFDWGTDIYRDRQVVSEKLQLARERLPADAKVTVAPISSIMGEVMIVALRSTDPGTTPQEKLDQAMRVRTLGEFTVRNRLLAVEGVSQVTVMGGVLRQYQVVTAPDRLAAQGVTLEQLTKAAENANVIAGGGVMERTQEEHLIRISGQSLTLDDIGETPVLWRDKRAVRIRDVADVRFAGPVRRGDASVGLSIADFRLPIEELPHSDPHSEVFNRQSQDAVVLAIQKQPGANTLELTPKIDAALDGLERELPADVKVERHVFRQADFIRAAIDNVVEAIRDGTIWVVLILLLFLANLRTSFITLAALPLSVLVTVLVFHALGLTINTMTLGGIAVAVGELVDDAVVDVENIYRRLKGNARKSAPDPPLKVIFKASSEVRNSVVYATLIVCLVVLPLFALSGLEGRMFAPLALAYVVSLVASLAVSLTVTPALSAVLLISDFRLKIEEPKSNRRTVLSRLFSIFNRQSSTLTIFDCRLKIENPESNGAIRSRLFSIFNRQSKIVNWRDTPLLRALKWLDAKVVRWALRHPRKVLVVAAVLAFGSKFAVLGMGSEFLPPFNEGTLTVNVQTRPGTSLEESKRVAGRAEALLWEVPEVVAVARRTGRAEQDEHAEGVNTSELEVRLTPHERPRPGFGYALLRAVPGLHARGVEATGRPHGEVQADIRDRVARLPNVNVNVGQPISHRLDHLVSGVRAQVAIKVFGDDLRELVTAAYDIRDRVGKIPGVVDLQVEPQENIKQVRLEVDRKAAAEYGLAPGEVARLLETAYKGRVVSTVLDRDRYFDLVVWYDEAARADRAVIGQTILDTPSGRKVALSQVARVLDARGPNTINHENVQRRVVVACNVQGRDLGSVVGDIQLTIDDLRLKIESEKKQAGGNRQSSIGNLQFVVGGQFEAQQQANTLLFWLFWVVLLGVFLLLWKCLNSWVAAAMVLLINIPLAALGSVVALMLLNRPMQAALDAVPWWQWPQAWASATTLSVAHWVGFITLIGIVSRNGIMMVAHYIHLQKEEGEAFGDAMIVRGTLERLAPVLMTALTAILGLIPLALGAGQTGKEILHPLAIVVIGGLIDATIMDQIVTPAAFKLFGQYVYRKPDTGADGPPAAAWDDAWLHEPAAVPVNRLEAAQPPAPVRTLAPVVAVVPDASAVSPPPSPNGTGGHVP